MSAPKIIVKITDSDNQSVSVRSMKAIYNSDPVYKFRQPARPEKAWVGQRKGEMPVIYGSLTEQSSRSLYGSQESPWHVHPGRGYSIECVGGLGAPSEPAMSTHTLTQQSIGTEASKARPAFAGIKTGREPILTG